MKTALPPKEQNQMVHSMNYMQNWNPGYDMPQALELQGLNNFGGLKIGQNKRLDFTRRLW